MRSLILSVVFALMAVLTTSTVAAQTPAPAVTFGKDVAPILQAKCQVCHRPDGGAPFSMLTYAEVRPWARAIKQRVEQRTMPPWHIDARVGTANKFHNDPSLSDEEIATIGRWVSAGAPEGNRADMPAPRTFPAAQNWQIGGGKPDLIVKQDREFKMYPKGNDVWADYVMDPKLTEDVWIKELQLRPGNSRIVHHVVVWAIPQKRDDTAVESTEGEGGGSPLLGGWQMLYTFVPGRPASFYPADAGLLLRAGTKIRFSMHYAASGKDETDQTELGLVFRKKNEVPKHRIQAIYISVDQEKIDIQPNTVTRMSGYYRINKPTLLTSWTPHMHQRGKGQVLQAILPSGKVETLTAVDRYDFAWQITYHFDDDVAPMLPAGTVLHMDISYDNTAANRTNPDPKRWVGYGQASTDEMGGAFIDFVQLEQAEFDKLVAERQAKMSNTSKPGSTSAAR